MYAEEGLKTGISQRIGLSFFKLTTLVNNIFQVAVECLRRDTSSLIAALKQAGNQITDKYQVISVKSCL